MTLLLTPRASRALRLSTVTREHCEVVLGMTNGHVREAAKILGCGWTTLYRWIAEWKREDEKRTKRKHPEEDEKCQSSQPD